jgi:hypothetical protein
MMEPIQQREKTITITPMKLVSFGGKKGAISQCVSAFIQFSLKNSR